MTTAPNLFTSVDQWLQSRCQIDPETPAAVLGQRQDHGKEKVAARAAVPGIGPGLDTPKDNGPALCDRRATEFAAKGVAAQDADLLAARLWQRDQELDDRRSCAECESFQNGRCRQRRQPFGGGGVEVLHRCPGFQLEPWT